MREVEDEPMCVDHTYPDKEILLMRIAEMANLKHCEVCVDDAMIREATAKGMLCSPS